LEKLKTKKFCLVTCRNLSNSLHNVIVYNIDYRKAPEVSYRTIIDDVYNGIHHVYQLHTDPNNTTIDINNSINKKPSLLIIGSSAGGHLAAIVEARIKNEAVIDVKGLALRCPVTTHPCCVPEEYLDKYCSWEDNERKRVGEGLLSQEKMMRCFG